MNKIIESLANRELKRFRIDQRQIRDWILPNGLQKYQFNFIKVFAQEFVSYNELNIIKCLNIKLRGKGLGLLHCIKDFEDPI